MGLEDRMMSIICIIICILGICGIYIKNDINRVVEVDI